MGRRVKHCTLFPFTRASHQHQSTCCEYDARCAACRLRYSRVPSIDGVSMTRLNVGCVAWQCGGIMSGDDNPSDEACGVGLVCYIDVFRSEVANICQSISKHSTVNLAFQFSHSSNQIQIDLDLHGMRSPTQSQMRHAAIWQAFHSGFFSAS